VGDFSEFDGFLAISPVKSV